MEHYVELGLTALVVVVWYLLRQKDTTQSEQIKLLFEKHDHDAKALEDLRLEIARSHYERPELDKKFDKLEENFRQGFFKIEAKLDSFLAEMRKT